MLKDLSEYDQFKKQQTEGKVVLAGSESTRKLPHAHLQSKSTFKERREILKQK